jgi:hypothetical protein
MKNFDRNSNRYLTNTKECYTRIFGYEEKRFKRKHNEIKTTEMNRIFSMLPLGETQC